MRLVSRLTNNLDKFVILLSFISLVIFLTLWFGISTNSYFSQDDFFHLRMIMDKDISDIPGFFTNRLEGQTFYRPLSRETFNLIAYKTFGLNPLPFHLFNLGLIIFNTLLIFILIKKISTLFILSIITVIIYDLSAIHSIELYYLASVQTLLATNLMLFSILFYAKFLKAQTLEKYLASLLFFLLALLSHESAIVLPAILAILDLHHLKFKLKFNAFVGRLISFGAISLLQIFSIFTSLSLPTQEVYKPIFNIKSILNTFSWYSLWSLNFPEMLVDFIGSGFSLNPNFIKWYGSYALTVSILFSFILLSLLFLILKFRKSIFKNKLLYLFLLCYVISLTPFLFFPMHKYVYYLSFPSVWILAVLGLFLSIAWQKSIRFKILVLFTIFAFGIFSFQTINLNKKTYWAAKRAVAAKAILDSLKRSYPIVDKDAVFYIVDDPSYPHIAKEWGTSSQQAFYILSGADALKLLYNKSSIKTYYESNGGLPNNVEKNKVIIIMAKFPY